MRGELQIETAIFNFLSNHSPLISTIMPPFGVFSARKRFGILVRAAFSRQAKPAAVKRSRCALLKGCAAAFEWLLLGDENAGRPQLPYLNW
jgi:hypothetical protein